MRRVAYQPQQSVLKRQAGQRHTACMRYISAPQRSHTVRLSSAGTGPALRADRMGVIGGSGRGSAIVAIIAEARQTVRARGSGIMNE
jgi:hypothetical protein